MDFIKGIIYSLGLFIGTSYGLATFLLLLVISLLCPLLSGCSMNRNIKTINDGQEQYNNLAIEWFSDPAEFTKAFSVYNDLLESKKQPSQLSKEEFDLFKKYCEMKFDMLEQVHKATRSNAKRLTALEMAVTEPEPSIEPQPITESYYTNNYHHIMQDASELGGPYLSFVLCPGQHMDSCEADGQQFMRWQNDEGRETFALVNGRNKGKFVLECKNGNDNYLFQADGTALQFGVCD